MRVVDSTVHIPHAVDQWFEAGALDPTIAALAKQYRAAEISKLERELFALRKRRADAERTLATRPTKAATESKRIAIDKIARALWRLEQLREHEPRPADTRIFPQHYAPIALEAGGRRVLRLARYHCRRPGDPASVDRKWPGLYNARRDNLERFWRGQFGTTHAVLVVESFFENVQRDGHNQVLHFTPRPHEPMLVACLYAEWMDPRSGQQLLSFAAITDEPPAEVAAAGHDRMIVSLKPEHVDAWLTPAGRSVEDLQAILSDR